ncbi:hypothetical protein OEZ85_011399 [Tetradesmus obliquus]|uniref:protein-serine/threonine phosphatase n=1 Tax=Tetradesmus obliquus TaxID=3088 RepID=A0ABY8TQ84_TETOB|nr:hypothetical protein OEZ85_011399 [Tetradesmus obliquus]
MNSVAAKIFSSVCGGRGLHSDAPSVQHLPDYSSDGQQRVLSHAAAEPPSMLSDSGRASRRTSLMHGDSFSDSPVPPIVHQSLAMVSPEQQLQAGEPFWANSNWSFGSHSDQNQRQHMEDRIACRNLTQEPAFTGCKRAGFFAVFDGHAGHEAAEYLEEHLLSYVLASAPEQLLADPLAVLQASVLQAEREILAKFLPARCNAGSTLLALLLVDDKLHIANVGDSRAVMGRGSEAQQLTRDHKPACSLEQRRITEADPQADISTDGYMYGELAVARAIGSAHIKRDPSKRALIPTPEVHSVQLQAEDDFVVLATDGLWDKVDNSEVIQVARRTLAGSRRDPQGPAAAASRALVDRALRRSSSDNISVIMLLLHSRPITLPKSNSMLFKRSTLQGLGGADSPRCSTPCSGVSTPVAASRSSTPVQQHGQAIGSSSALPSPLSSCRPSGS